MRQPRVSREEEDGGDGHQLAPLCCLCRQPHHRATLRVAAHVSSSRTACQTAAAAVEINPHKQTNSLASQGDVLSHTAHVPRAARAPVCPLLVALLGWRSHRHIMSPCSKGGAVGTAPTVPRAISSGVQQAARTGRLTQSCLNSKGISLAEDPVGAPAQLAGLAERLKYFFFLSSLPPLHYHNTKDDREENEGVPSYLFPVPTSSGTSPPTQGTAMASGAPQLGQTCSVHRWWPRGWGQASTAAPRLTAAWHWAQ